MTADYMGRPSMSLTEMLRSGQGWRPAGNDTLPADALGVPEIPVTELARKPRKPRKPRAEQRQYTPRPTVYAGVEFRSRLEARWAAFFDVIDWPWTYEPFDGDGYIPDFLVHRHRPGEVRRFSALVEVKPAVTKDEYRAPIPKITKGLDGHWDGHVMIVGLDPLPAWDWEPGEPFTRDSVPAGYPPAYLLGVPPRNESEDWCFQAMPWPSGLPDSKIRDAWAKACNTTKWLPTGKD